MDRPDVVTLGETMVVLVATEHGRMRYASGFIRLVGGAESTFAITISRLGLKAGWIGRLGRDEFGAAVASCVQAEGVDVSRIAYDQNRPTGVMFKERPLDGDARVVYYRRNSAAARMAPQTIDWNYVMTARVIHLTGITLALSKECHDTVFEAFERSRNAGIPVSFDANVRLKLRSPSWWRASLTEAIPAVSWLFVTAEEAELITGTSAPEVASQKLLQMGPRTVVVKHGAAGAVIRTATLAFHQPAYPVEHVVSSHGAGDVFAAGFIGAHLLGMPDQAAAKVASLLGAAATTTLGPTQGLPLPDDLAHTIKDLRVDRPHRSRAKKTEVSR